MLMYLGLLERNFSQGGFYIIDMSSIKYTNYYISKQKLKCFQNYIKTFYLNSDAIQNDQLIFTKNTFNKEEFKKKFEQSIYQNIDFEFTQLKNEDHQNSTVVDFADQNIGGLVLDTRNCAQEEIFMLIFPEATVSKIFISQMNETEEVLIENLKIYSNYTGYEQSFNCQPSMTLQGNYNMLLLTKYHFTVKLIYRKKYQQRIYKTLCRPNCYISTGRWGCGIFRGNPYLKTLIQFLIFAIAVNQSFFTFGVQLKKLQGHKGVQLNLINLKKSILYVQNGINQQAFYIEGNNIISQIYTILTQDIQQIQKLRLGNDDDVIQAQIDQEIKLVLVNAPIIEENKEIKMLNNQENKNRNYQVIGIAIIFAIAVGVFTYKKVFK
ncbi:unnamed protein product [Paramecium pentaurelia]|uniref:PARG catalytic Macro domain-containing protein n=1 Tax=Paramecium pentaurelia TaxID=43138 RepID=A0A8S1XUY0_9CILI|nr:unnamed protein product [Paramecium pentaurelia]